jgi:hypothetical protein
MATKAAAASSMSSLAAEDRAAEIDLRFIGAGETQKGCSPLGSVEIHRELMTAAQRLIIPAKLVSVCRCAWRCV